MAVVSHYGNGEKLQPIYIAFALMLSVSIAAFVPAVFSAGTNFKRWHVWVLHLGFLGAVGVLLVGAFLILEVQGVSLKK